LPGHRFVEFNPNELWKITQYWKVKARLRGILRNILSSIKEKTSDTFLLADDGC